MFKKFLRAVSRIFKNSKDPKELTQLIVTPKPNPPPPGDNNLSAFKFAFNHVLGAEGGYSNDPHDSGGPTNWGITLKTLAAYRGRHTTVQDVKELSKGEAEKIYYKSYWRPMGLDKIDHVGIATALFDQGVNRGIYTAIMMAQRVMGVKQDGQLGPITIAAIERVPPAYFINQFHREVVAGYEAIVVRNPSQIKFLKGWKNRADGLLELKDIFKVD
jgi:lysozyme family protein